MEIKLETLKGQSSTEAPSSALTGLVQVQVQVQVLVLVLGSLPLFQYDRNVKTLRTIFNTLLETSFQRIIHRPSGIKPVKPVAAYWCGHKATGGTNHFFFNQ